MRADRRSRVRVLLLVLTALVAVLAWQFWPDVDRSPAGSAGDRNRQAGRTGGKPAGGIEPGEFNVTLSALDRPVAREPQGERDPFRFGPAPTPSPPPSLPLADRLPPGGGAPMSTVEESGAVAPTPPPPPITLKFIGLLSEGAPARRIAVLSDGRFVFQGREGDIIEGRYRVVRIGEESVQLEYVDGRGRQTIRLSGA